MSKVHKTIEEAGAHLGESVSAIPARYEIATSKATWEEPATSEQSERNFQDGISEAIAKDSRRVGIRAAGDVGYHKGCKEKGAKVIGTRIREAIPRYKANMGPILAAMNSAADSAPARTRDPMLNIEQRLKPVVTAAIAAKRK